MFLGIITYLKMMWSAPKRIKMYFDGHQNKPVSDICSVRLYISTCANMHHLILALVLTVYDQIAD